MTSRPHFEDLRRRYREADWVSEFQRLWAIFNHWLVAHVGKTKDRDCIEDLKSSSELTRWVNNIVERTAVKRPHRVTEGFGGSYPRFTSNNEISILFRAVAESPTIEPRINYPWRAGTEPRVQPTNAIVLSGTQFRSAYEAHAEALGSVTGITYDLTLHQTLPFLGVDASGCCFYKCNQTTDPPENIHFAGDVLNRFRSRDELQSLVNLINSSSSTDLASDVIETLYNVRNTAMHGSLDFLNEQDNAAARAGYDALDSLIRDIRDRW